MNFKKLKRNLLISFVAFIGVLTCLTLINDTSKTVTAVQTVKAAKKTKKIKYYDDMIRDRDDLSYYDLGHGKFILATKKVKAKAVRVYNDKKKSKFMMDGQCIVKFNKKSKTLHISAGKKGNKLGTMDVLLTPGINPDYENTDDFGDYYDNIIEHISIDSKIVAPKDSSQLFSGLAGLENFIGLDNIDTSKVTNMSEMFGYDENLESLDLSNWDTKHVKDMSSMFICDKFLTSVNLGKWDTSSVTNTNMSMSDMFVDCDHLSQIKTTNNDLKNDLGNKNTDKRSNSTYLDPHKDSDDNDDEDSNDNDSNDNDDYDENEDSDNENNAENSNDDDDEDSNDDYDQDDSNYVYNLNAVEMPKLDFNNNK